MSPSARGSAPGSDAETRRHRKECSSSRSLADPPPSQMNSPPLTFTYRDNTAAARADIVVARGRGVGLGRRKVVAGYLVLRVANHAAAQRPLRADDLLALPRDHHVARAYERTGCSVDLPCELPWGLPCGWRRRNAGSGSASVTAGPLWRRLPFEACFGRCVPRPWLPPRACCGAPRASAAARDARGAGPPGDGRRCASPREPRRPGGGAASISRCRAER